MRKAIPSKAALTTWFLLLADSGNIFSTEQLDALRRKGAVGDIVVRFFDENGQPVQNELDNRVVSMTLPQLRQVNRSVGVAGGKRKFNAILGALRGGLINVLITDCLYGRTPCRHNFLTPGWTWKIPDAQLTIDTGCWMAASV